MGVLFTKQSSYVDWKHSKLWVIEGEMSPLLVSLVGNNLNNCIFL